MSTGCVAEFQAGRRRWLVGIAQRILDSTTSQVLFNADHAFTDVEQAFLVTHVGLGHLSGFEDCDNALQGFLVEDQVTTLISRSWRKGRFDLRLAGNVEMLWACFFRLGPSTDTVRQSLFEAMASSRLGTQMLKDSPYASLGHESEDRLMEVLTQDPVTPSPVDSSTHLELDSDGSHLPLVRALYDREGLAALRLVTALELLACLPDSVRSSRNDAALLAARRLQYLSKSVCGGWPGRYKGDVPSWVRDAVTVNDERLIDASVGFVPSLIFVADSDDTFQALKRWAYAPKPLEVYASSNTLSFRLEFESRSVSDTIALDWSFDTNDSPARTSFEAALAVGLLRLDIYKMDVFSRLEFEFSVGCRLDVATIDGCHKYLEDHGIGKEPSTAVQNLTSARLLQVMSRVEQGSFNNLSLGLSAPSGSLLDISFKDYLTAVDAMTPAAINGIVPPIRDYEYAREKYLAEVLSSKRMRVETIDVAALGEQRAYAQFLYTEDGGRALAAYVAYLDAEGMVVDTFEFESTTSAEWTIEEQSIALSVGLRKLRTLLDKGISKIVVNAHSVTYNFPYHEALLRIGFTEVSYTHRAATLSRAERPPRPGTVVAGFPGKEQDYLRAVSIEIAFVTEIYESEDSEFSLANLPRTVHLSGHGYAGYRNYEVALAIYADDAALSAARVLLDVDASGTELVYLSACSTGQGSYTALHVEDAIPLDVAFIEKGARSVLSTSAKVNDYVACFFACVFHEARECGSSIWDAYVRAREAARTQQAPDRPRLVAMLNRIWPTWNQDLLKGSAAHPDDWQLFRLSGKHWT